MFCIRDILFTMKIRTSENEGMKKIFKLIGRPFENLEIICLLQFLVFWYKCTSLNNSMAKLNFFP